MSCDREHRIKELEKQIKELNRRLDVVSANVLPLVMHYYGTREAERFAKRFDGESERKVMRNDKTNRV